MELLKIRKDGTFVVKCNTEYPYGSKVYGKNIPTGSLIISEQIYDVSANLQRVNFTYVDENNTSFLSGSSFNKPFYLGYFPIGFEQMLYDNACPVDLVSAYKDIYNGDLINIGDKNYCYEAKVDSYYNFYMSNGNNFDIRIILPDATYNRGEIIVLMRATGTIRNILIYQNYEAFYDNDIFTNITSVGNTYTYNSRIAIYSDGFKWIPFNLY